MNDLLKRILESKQLTRKHLAALPFSQKLEIAEKLRNRSLMLSMNKLRASGPKIMAYGVVVAGDSVSEIPLRSMGLTPPASHQSPDQQNIPRNSETLIATLLKRSGRWRVDPMVASEPEFETQR